MDYTIRKINGEDCPLLDSFLIRSHFYSSECRTSAKNNHQLPGITDMLAASEN